MTSYLFRKSILCSILLACPFTSTVFAQETKAAATVRLVAFSRMSDDLAVKIADSEGNIMTKEEVALPTQQLSPRVSLTSRNLVFLSPKNSETILAETTLPGSDRDYILMFLPSPKGSKLPYIVHAVPLSLKNFGSGDYAFFNYSSGTIGCKIGKESIFFPRGKATIYRSKPKDTGNKSRSLVCYSKAKNGEWNTVPFYSSRLVIQAGVRNLILISQDPRNGKVVFRGIPDFIPE